MAIYAELADGRRLEFPDGTDPEVIKRTIKRIVQSERKPEEGVGAAFVGGAKRMASTIGTGLEALISPEEAARRGVERGEEISSQYAPGASLEAVKQAYAERGLLGGAGEVVSQIPTALAEQFPQIAATLGSAKAGAMAGQRIAGPRGALVGGVGGAALPSLAQLFGANIERQAAEQMEAGEPLDISRTKAAAAAVPGAALEVAATFIPLGRNIVGKLLGPEAQKALARGATEATENLAKESLGKVLAKGTAVGALAEVPTEVIQQMLERAQAGLPLTTEDALAEYGEAAYGAGLVGGPFGAAGRVGQRAVARGEVAEREATARAEQEALAAEADKAEKERAAAEEEERIKRPEYRQELNAQLVEAKDRLRGIEGVLKDKTLDPDVKKEATEEAKDLRKTIGDLNAKMKKSMAAIGEAPTLQKAIAKQKEVDEERAVVDEFGNVITPETTLDVPQFDEQGRPITRKTKEGVEVLKTAKGKLPPALSVFEEIEGYETQAERALKTIRETDEATARIEEERKNAKLRKDEELQKGVKTFLQQMDELRDLPFGTTPIAESQKAQKEKEAAQEITFDRIQLGLDKFSDRLLGLKKDEGLAKLQAEYDRLSAPEVLGRIKKDSARQNYMNMLGRLEERIKQRASNAAPNSREGYRTAVNNGFVNRFVTGTLGIKGLGGRTVPFSEALPQVEERIAQLEKKRQQAITSKDPLMSDKGQLTPAGVDLVVNEAKLNELKKIAEGARLQMPEEPTATESAIAGRLAGELEGQGDLVAPELRNSPTSTLKGKLDTARKQSTGAFLDLTSYLDDYRKGRFFGEKGAKRDLAFASSTRAELLRDSEEARRRVIDNLINEIATEREIQKLRPLTKTEATALAIRADQILGELVERSMALPSGYFLEDRITIEAQMRGDKLVRGARTDKFDTRELKERQFGSPERAVEVLAEDLSNLRDQTVAQGKRPVLASYATDLIGSRPRDTKKSDAQLDVEDRIIEDVGQILPTLDPDSEAFRTLDEAATTLANEDVSRDFVDLVGEQVQRIRQGTDEATDPQLIGDIRSALDAQRAGREFAQAEDRTLVAEGKRFKEVDTQPDLFPETRATERATPATFQRFLKSEKVTKERERIADDKAKAEQTRKAADEARREVEKELSPENIANEKRKVLQEIADLVQKTRTTIAEEGLENTKTRSPKFKQLTEKLSSLAKDIDADKLEFEVTSEGAKITYVAPELLEQWARLDARIKGLVDNFKQLEARAERAQGGSLEQRKAKALAKQQRAALNAVMDKRNQAAEAIAKQQRTLQERLNRGLDLPGIRVERKSREELAKEIGEARAKAKEERKKAKAAGLPAEKIAAIKTKVPSKFKIAKLKDTSEVLEEQRQLASRKRGAASVTENLKALELQEADAVADLQKATKELKDWTKLINKAKTASDKETFKEYEAEFFTKEKELAQAVDAAKVKLRTISANKKLFSELRDVEYKTKPTPRERTTTGETKPAGLGVTEQQMYEYGVFGQTGGVSIKTNNTPEFAIGDSDPTGEIDVAEAKKFLADVKAKAAKQGIKVKIYPITEVMSPELYGETLTALGPEAARRVKGGVEPNGDVFFVIESHSTLQDLKETVAHELIGHYTFEGMLGEKGLKRLLTRLEKTHGNISKLAEKIGGEPLLRKVAQAEAMMKKIGATDDEVRMRGLNELVAYTMEKRVDQDFLTRAKQWLQELVGALRMGLRELGLDMGGMSTSELFYLMRQADRNFKSGKPIARIESDGTVKYSVGEDEVFKTGIGKMIAQRGDFYDRATSFATGMTGLAGRVKFLDRFAAIAETMKRGLSVGEISSLKAGDAMYFNRFADQRNNITAQFATAGVGRIVEEKGERRYGGNQGPSLKDVSETLATSGLPSKDAEYIATAYIAALRLQALKKEDPQAYRKLSTEGDISEADVNEVLRLYGANPALNKVREQYQQYNNNLIDFVVSTGAMEKAVGDRLKNKDYIPFYRAQGDDVFLDIMGEQPIRIGDLKNQPYLHELVGGKEKILPIFTSALTNTSILVDMALKNMATANTVDALRELGIAKVNKGKGPANRNVLRFKVKGEDFHAVIDTQAKADLFGDIPTELLVEGMEGVKGVLPVAIRMMGAPANWLRKFVTRDPRYAFRQIFRDSMAAAMTTGADFVPVVQTFKDMATMKKTGVYQELQEAGVLGGQVISGSTDDMGKILLQISSGKPGWESAMAKLDDLAMMGDAATRVSMYNSFLKQGLSKREAILATLEAMNFSRRGTSISVLYANTLIPFFNAGLQGLDVLYRAAKGDMEQSQRLRVQQKLLVRMGIMAGITVAYAAMMQDDETYENANAEERYGNWFVPTPFGTLRVPIPFELGLVAKAAPEGVYRLLFSDDSMSEVADALRKMALRSIPIDIPTAVKPIIEWNLNRSFFTDRDIVTASMPEDPKFQYNLSTPEVIKLFGNLGISPAQVENAMKGYTGSLGVSMLRLFDPVFGGELVKPGQDISKFPILGGLFQPEDASGIINAAYNTANSLESIRRTYNRLQQEDPVEARKYYEEKLTEISMSSMAGQFKQYMGQITAEERKVRASTSMTPEQKDKRLKELRQMKINFAKQFRQRERTLRQAA